MRFCKMHADFMLMIVIHGKNTPFGFRLDFHIEPKACPVGCGHVCLETCFYANNLKV